MAIDRSEQNWPDTIELVDFDYSNQAWAVNGRYVRCGHPDSMNCRCYGKLHEGEPVSTPPHS